MIDLLKVLASEVLIPPFVYKELFGKTGAETTQIEHALRDFIKVTPVIMPDPSDSGYTF